MTISPSSTATPSSVRPPSTPAEETTLRLALPKGRMKDGVFSLLADAGIRVRESSRGYRPTVSAAGIEAKILKPQTIVEMLAAGSRDAGFAGADWVAELGREDEVVELLDTGMDPVRIVAAAPESLLVDGVLPASMPSGKPFRIASEMQRITESWIAARGLDARCVRSYGATEVFPPEDADFIVDVTQSGATLDANRLVIIDQLMTSSTRLYASRAAMDDPARRERVEDLVMLVGGVLEARSRLMLDLNVSEADLARVLEALPCMREPTVASLRSGHGFAVRAAIPKADIATLIPRLKACGAADLVVTTPSHIVL